MATINISLPDSLKEFVEERVSEGGYSTASEYVRELLRQDQTRQNQRRVEALLLEGLSSGESAPMTAEDWSDIRREVQDRLKRKLDAK